MKPVSPELPQRYYLKNFESLCDSVCRQYRDLLSRPEQDFLQRFAALSEESRCLYVRLVSRRGPFFRNAELAYPELGELEPAICELLECGLVQAAEPDLETLFRLYRKNELLAIFAKYLDGDHRLAKGAMLEALQGRGLEPDTFVHCWRDWTDEMLLQPLAVEAVELLQLLFFGNRHQSLTDFVLSDLGVANYFPYPLEADFRLFRDRSEVEEYQVLSELRDQYYEAVEAENWPALYELVPRLEADGSTALLRERRDRLRNRVARQLERIGEQQLALHAYSSCQSHPARERQVRILQTMQLHREALDLCSVILEQAWCEAERDFAERQAALLAKKLGLDHRPVPRLAFSADRVQLPAGKEGVELAAARWLTNDWAEVHYVENSLVNGLFGLAFWEQIFAPVPGAFVNPFQLAPLDMDSPEFYQRRRRDIDRQLDYLSASADFAGELLGRYRRYQGYSNRWVNWRALHEELLALALALIPREKLIAIWRRILFDPKANRSGFPDLIALDPDRGYRMIEVKGPGDQLQQNQKRWLRFFAEQDIPFSVLRVEWLA